MSEYTYKRVLNDDGSEKHVEREGARYHVLSWSTDGTHCSEPNCEINRLEPMKQEWKLGWPEES